MFSSLGLTVLKNGGKYAVEISCAECRKAFASQQDFWRHTEEMRDARIMALVTYHFAEGHGQKPSVNANPS